MGRQLRNVKPLAFVLDVLHDVAEPLFVQVVAVGVNVMDCHFDESDNLRNSRPELAETLMPDEER